jgi:hypothetical protein
MIVPEEAQTGLRRDPGEGTVVLETIVTGQVWSWRK